MTATTRRDTRVTTPETANGKAALAKRQFGKEIGKLALNAYERGVADLVAFEKEAATISRTEWVKSMFVLHAGLVEDIGAAYVKTARAALR
jgi:hypothetical protein